MKDNNTWADADEKGIIHVPDELDPLINKVGMQMKFHTISGKSEAETICHIVWNAQKFFRENPQYLTVGKGCDKQQNVHPVFEGILNSFTNTKK